MSEKDVVDVEEFVDVEKGSGRGIYDALKEATMISSELELGFKYNEDNTAMTDIYIWKTDSNEIIINTGNPNINESLLYAIKPRVVPVNNDGYAIYIGDTHILTTYK